MTLLSRAKAQKFVGPHFGGLFNIVNNSWHEYISDYTAKQKAKHSPLTRATIVHDLMMDGAARYFADLPNFRAIDSLGLKLFTWPCDDGLIAIRFKKLDEQLLSRNQPSQQVTDFRGQRTIDAVGRAYHLEAGYVLDRNQQNIQTVSLVCPNGAKNHWDMELTATEAIVKVHELFDAERVDDKVDIVRGKGRGVTKTPKKNDDKDK